MRVGPTLQRLRTEYPESVRIVFKMHPLPMHKQAGIAAEAALAAHAQGKFTQMHDKLLDSSRSLSREKILEIASEIGLDMERFTKDLDSGAHRATVEKETQEARKIGATGTPASFVNGRFLSGAQPFEAFKKLVDEALAKSGEAPAGS